MPIPGYLPHRSGRLRGVIAPACVKVKPGVPPRPSSKSVMALNYSEMIAISSIRARDCPGSGGRLRRVQQR
jgi:hypothetical protein